MITKNKYGRIIMQIIKGYDYTINKTTITYDQ
jgi:hypothetical protein